MSRTTVVFSFTPESKTGSVVPKPTIIFSQKVSTGVFASLKSHQASTSDIQSKIPTTSVTFVPISAFDKGTIATISTTNIAILDIFSGTSSPNHTSLQYTVILGTALVVAGMSIM